MDAADPTCGLCAEVSSHEIETAFVTATIPEARHVGRWGGRGRTLCSIGAIGMSLGRDLQWDADAERFVGDDEAKRMLSYAMREPWAL
jgi:hypothetical protein